MCLFRLFYLMYFLLCNTVEVEISLANIFGNDLSFEICFRLFGSPTSRQGMYGCLFDCVTKISLWLLG